MRSNTWKSLLAVLALTMLVTPAFAKSIQRIITINGSEKVAGKELKNDDYTFKVDDTKLVVELRHKVVAETTGHWVDRDKKYSTDTVVATEDGQIQELRFAGEKRAFVIGSN
jgi:hypothetical protein